MNEQLDVLFVNVGGTKKRVYQELSNDYSAIETPFWAVLTAGFIRKKGFNVDILDANAENITHEETAEKIKQKNPKLVDIVVYGQHPSASTQLMTAVGELCKKIKSINFGGKIILTGLHPSALPERTLKEETCDFVCEGEGFYTVLGLAQGKNLSEILGLWYKDNGEVRHNLRAPNIQNLTEELNEVAWDLLSMDKYKAHNWQCLDNLENRPFYASLSTSLGCQFNCSFCSIKATFGGERLIRYWNPEWVINQIDILVNKYHVKIIKIIDELFIFSPAHFLEIADKLIERNYDLNIWAYARVDVTLRMGEEMLKTLRKAGFKWLCFGFEAASEAVLGDVWKGQYNENDMIKVREMCKKADINVLGNFMFGLPEDDFESMQKTLDLAFKMNCEFINIYCTIAWPGSQLYKNSIDKNVEMPKEWAEYAQHAYGFIPLPSNKLSAKQILEFRDYAFDAYFKNPRYLDYIEKRFGKIARQHIENMTKIKLKRRLFED